MRSSSIAEPRVSFLLLPDQDEKQSRFRMRDLEEVMLLKTPPSHAWWFNAHNSPKRSPWLQATLSELDRKTKAMLKLIEEDADSFSQRAEMYYKKRPELVNIVEDFYRTHRALAERYDQLKSDAGTRFSTDPFGYPFSTKHLSQKLTIPTTENFSETSSDCFDSEESEVVDPEEEEESQVDVEMIREQVSSYKEENGEVVKLREEVERLKEENRMQEAELMVKDEEKREAIRQLCLSMEILKEENVSLRKCIQDSKKDSLFGFGKWKEVLFRKIFEEVSSGFKERELVRIW